MTATTTIKDVARQVGLSVTTVSRALNDYDDVAATTRARVQEVARALDYHPNAHARSLQGSRANTVGLVIPLVVHHSYDAFWLEFVGGVAAACASRGVDLLVATADAYDAHDAIGHGLQQLARSRRVDGVLVGDILQNDPRIAYLQKRRFPFVAFGRTVGTHDYPFVDIDGTAGVVQAMDYLFSLGHRRIAYFGLDPAFGFSHYRFLGYQQALKRVSIPCDPVLVRHCLTEAAVPEELAALLYLADPPTAVFATADFLALATLKAAHALGRVVPGDLSLIAFDDSLLVQHAEPPMTAVSQPNRQLGEQAAALLLDRVAAPDAPLVQRLVVPALVTRASSAPPRSA